jgi:hypothetical protein
MLGTKITSPRPGRRRSLLLTTAATVLLLAGSVATAAATPSIEGVWSFKGGEIAIQPTGSGTFVGTVVVATTFDECEHPVGQQIWTDITPQPDGSYEGDHQWYFAAPTCNLNKILGPTAWRVRQEPNGSSYLEVCLSHPGTTQPTIPAAGEPTGVSYDCVDSALTAPLPGSASSGAAGFKESLTLPSVEQCVSRRFFKIHLLDPKYDPLKRVTITLRGHKIANSRRGKYIVATIDLRGLPRRTFTLKIHATTILGHHLSASRTYHTCISKIVKKNSKKKPGRKG